jgi:hypothetical protein
MGYVSTRHTPITDASELVPPERLPGYCGEPHRCHPRRIFEARDFCIELTFAPTIDPKLAGKLNRDLIAVFTKAKALQKSPLNLVRGQPTTS